MIEIKPKKKKKRYEGLKGKLIHLDKDTFRVLNSVAKIKGVTLKKYLELLCVAQAKSEANFFLKNFENNNAENKRVNSKQSIKK